MEFIKKIQGLFKKSKKNYWSIIHSGGMTSEMKPKHNYTQSQLLEFYNNWNYVCINIIANHICNTKTYLMKKEKNNVVEILQHPVLDILNKPNDIMDRNQFLEKIFIWLELTGNVFIKKIRNGNGKTIQLLPIRPDIVEIEIDKNGFVKNYIINGNTQETMNVNDIIHIRHENPYSYYWGISPTYAILELILLDREIRNCELAYFQNGAIPEFLVIAKTNMSETEFKRIKETWNETYDISRNAHKPAFLTGDIDVKPIGVPLKDQQFQALSRWVRDSILQSYFIPNGIFESSTTIATALQADTIFQRETILPRLNKIYSALNTHFVNEYDSTMYIEYDNPVPRDREFEMRRNIAYVNAGIYTINEVRQMEGYEKVEWGDMPINYISQKKNNNNIIYNDVKNKIAKSNDEIMYEKIWYEYIKQRKNPETELKQKIIIAFNEDRKRLKKNLIAIKSISKKIDIEDILIAEDEMRKYWIDILIQNYKNIFQQNGQMEFERFMAGIKWDIEKPYIIENINFLLNEGVKEIVKTTRQQLKEKLATAIKEGSSYEELSELIDETITNWQKGKSRAWMVARTEHTKISNAGKLTADLEIEKSQNVKMEKIWISAIDERTRETHARANGETVDIEEAFSRTGEALQFPGDPAGSPENIINCRCTYTSRIKEKHQ